MVRANSRRRSPRGRRPHRRRRLQEESGRSPGFRPRRLATRAPLDRKPDQGRGSQRDPGSRRNDVRRLVFRSRRQSRHLRDEHPRPEDVDGAGPGHHQPARRFLSQPLSGRARHAPPNVVPMGLTVRRPDPSQHLDRRVDLDAGGGRDHDPPRGRLGSVDHSGGGRNPASLFRERQARPGQSDQ